MHPLLVPAILALAALRTSTTKPSAAARAIPAPPQPSRSPQAARAMPAAQAAPLKNRARVNVGPAHINPPLEVSHEPEHPNVMPAPPQAQAAVDAAMSQVVRELKAPSPELVIGPAVIDKDEDGPGRAAAQKLLAFLIKTGRFGTLAHDPGPKDRPKEIKAAQTVLGVMPDGIVGPKTRAAAAAVGVALPPRPKK